MDEFTSPDPQNRKDVTVSDDALDSSMDQNPLRKVSIEFSLKRWFSQLHLLLECYNPIPSELSRLLWLKARYSYYCGDHEESLSLYRQCENVFAENGLSCITLTNW